MPTDPRGLRGDAPLLDAWLRFREHPPTPFTIPGHKGRTDLVGDVVAGDVPLYAGLDTMKLATGVLADAESRAARLWGADVCRFSTGGATHANQAVALAVAGDGDTVVVSRTLHRSLLLGLVLAGLTPCGCGPRSTPPRGCPSGSRRSPYAVRWPRTPRRGRSSSATRRTSARSATSPGWRRPRTRTAYLSSSTPRGPPTSASTRTCHATPLQLGADVMVTSAHKTLPAWSQAAIVLARTERIDAARLDAGVEATATTSPSGAILASTDAARALLERDGEQLLGAAIAATRDARDRLREVGLQVLDGPAVDPLKLTVVLSASGADGIAVEQDLLAAGLPVESADRDVLVAVVTLADTAETIGTLADAVIASVERHRGPSRPVVGPAAYRVEPVAAVPPRQAFFSATETVALDRAVGRVCAELIAPYPPGIPVLAPGERITEETLDALAQARDAGVRIAYAADPSLATVRVTAE